MEAAGLDSETEASGLQAGRTEEGGEEAGGEVVDRAEEEVGEM